MNWSGLQKTRHDLKRPLLVVSGSKGVLACGYINPATCETLGDAAAIVRGVNDFDDMLDAEIVEATTAAQELGVQVGMSGREALERFR